MQYIHKNILGPRDLKSRKIKYLKLLQENNLYNFKSLKKITKEQNKLIYDFYKKNNSSYGINYNTTKTKLGLIKSGKNRCCFCGRTIVDGAKYNSEQNFKFASIEHYMPKIEYPLKICNWHNLFPACQDCNGSRGTKKIELGYSPESIKFINIIKKITFLSDGSIYATDSKIVSFLNAYNLNSDDLKSQRRSFYFQIIDSNFQILMKMEGEKDKYKNFGIIFIDEYNSIYKYIHLNQKQSECTLIKMFKEILKNE